MIQRKLLLAVFYMMFATTVGSLAQDNELDPELGPLFRSQRMSEESWRENVKDYYTVDISTNGSIDGGSVSTTTTDCRGYTTASPTYRIDWVRENVEESESLRLFFVTTNQTDATLIILEPDEEWECADNWKGTKHPLIDISKPRTGHYNIWVANATAQAPVEGVLYVTIGDYEPNQPPPISGQFVPIFLGSGVASAQIVYVESYSDTEKLLISVDAGFQGERGDEFRVLVYPYSLLDVPIPAKSSSRFKDSDGFIVIQQLINMRRNIETYDYGTGSYHPLEFIIPNSEFSKAVDRYYPVVIIQKLVSTQWEEVTRHAANNDVHRIS